MSERARTGLFLLLMVGAALPWVGPAVALAAGALFTLAVGNPAPARTALWSKALLKVSVVGLGFGLGLGSVLLVGARSALVTAVGIALTLLAGALLGRLAGTAGPLSTLISFGTAICGGSAIAALAPVVKAKSEEIAVSLATVFTLNAVALGLFPAVGRLVPLDQGEFGLWAALAIHDTSSVVGAASAYGPEALALATTVKLTRALWIMPCVLLFGLRTRSSQKAKPPLFIAGFVLAAALRTAAPALQPLWDVLVALARQGLVVTLFLIGTGLTRDVFRRVGLRPLAHGLSLWVLVSAATLAAVVAGLVPVPR